MVVKKKAGRPRKNIIKSDKLFKKVPDLKKISETKSIETKQEKKQEELFPSRKPIYGGEQYVPADATLLTRNGEPWVPEEHGYVARFMDPDTINKMGWRGYQPVPVESGIRVADHPLTAQEIGGIGPAGKGVYYHPKTNEAVQKALGGEELTRLTGGKSNVVKLNSSILALAPIELVQSRRKFAKMISNNALKKSLIRAHEDAQEELGHNPEVYGKFSTPKNSERYEADKRTKSIKKVWAVSAQIK